MQAPVSLTWEALPSQTGWMTTTCLLRICQSSGKPHDHRWNLARSVCSKPDRSVFSKDCNDLVDSNVIFNVSMPLQHNTSQGIPVRGSARCTSSTNISAVPNCASLYSQSALQPDACTMAALSRFVRTRVANLKSITICRFAQRQRRKLRQCDASSAAAVRRRWELSTRCVA